MINKFENSDIGKWVTYKTNFEEERGKLKSFNNETKIAWVVYKANGNWDAGHWKDYTAQSTKYEDLVI